MKKFYLPLLLITPFLVQAQINDSILRKDTLQTIEIAAKPIIEQACYRTICYFNFTCINDLGTLLPDSAVSNTLISELRLRPVPANSYVTASWETPEDPTEIRIIDMNGRIVYRQALSATRESTIDVSGFNQGIYSAMLIGSKGETRSAKFIVVH